MKQYYYDDIEQDACRSWEDRYSPDSNAAGFDSGEADDFSYADENHTDDDDIEEVYEKKKTGKRQKSPERISRENQFVSLYEEYMHPTQKRSAYRTDCLLSDLFALLCDLNRGWAYRKAKSYRLAGFRAAEGDDALIIGCTPVYALLQADKAAGNYCSYPVAHYLRIAQNKAVDLYFRAEFGRLPPRKKNGSEEKESPAPSPESRYNRKEPPTVSLDASRENHDGQFWGDRWREASVDPFANMRRHLWERDEKSHRLSVIYLRELMDYSLEPQKPLALMYGNVLYQLAKRSGNNDKLSQMAKDSPKVNSAEWAHKRMGKATLLQLGIYSERVIGRCYHDAPSWGSAFRDHMKELDDDGRTRKWADIIYTETYTERNTSHWIESIFQSTMAKCARQLTNDPDLREYAAELLGVKNKFRKMLEKCEKEACK